VQAGEPVDGDVADGVGSVLVGERAARRLAGTIEEVGDALERGDGRQLRAP
jgi:hypothetical protein